MFQAFFGIVRAACGSHDHPDAILFLQVYHLLSFYSLVKPPKGSNVEGVDLFRTFLNFDPKKQATDNRDDFDEILDLVILKGPGNEEQIIRPGDEHDNNVTQDNKEVQVSVIMPPPPEKRSEHLIAGLTVATIGRPRKLHLPRPV